MVPASKTATRWTHVLVVSALVLRATSKATEAFCGLPAMAKDQHGLADAQLAGGSATIIASLRSYGEAVVPPVMLSTPKRLVGNAVPMFTQTDMVKLRSARNGDPADER